MYNKDQWISSFEDAVLKLRPHTSSRMLITIGNMAWHKYGTKNFDPAEAAKDWSRSMGGAAEA